MSFNNWKTPRRPDQATKYPLPLVWNKQKHVREYVLEGENLRMFLKLFPIHSNRRLMNWFGLSYRTVQRFARQHGIEKNMDAIRREHSRDVKKTCEANGYYDSIRGRRPSEASIEATKRLRASGFNPWLAVKENNPRRYRKLREKQSADRKELFRKEALREKYGMKRKTKLRLSALTQTARSHKHSMIVKNNYFADPDHVDYICYDSETRRSARREDTARRHGLTVVEGED